MAHQRATRSSHCTRNERWFALRLRWLQPGHLVQAFLPSAKASPTSRWMRLSAPNVGPGSLGQAVALGVLIVVPASGAASLYGFRAVFGSWRPPSIRKPQNTFLVK